jgi:hypothetical protein
MCNGGGVVAAVGDVGVVFEEHGGDLVFIVAGVEGRRMQAPFVQCDQVLAVRHGWISSPA